MFAQELEFQEEGFLHAKPSLVNRGSPEGTREVLRALTGTAKEAKDMLEHLKTSIIIVRAPDKRKQ